MGHEIMMVYITQKEFDAIEAGRDMIATAMEGAGEEFNKSYAPDVEALENLKRKYLKAKKRNIAFKVLRRYGHTKKH